MKEMNKMQTTNSYSHKKENSNKHYINAQKHINNKYHLKLDGNSQIGVNDLGQIVVGVRSCPILVRDPNNMSRHRKGGFQFKKNIHEALCNNKGDYILVLMYHEIPIADLKLKAQNLDEYLFWDKSDRAYIAWDAVFDVSQVMQFFTNHPLYIPHKNGDIKGDSYTPKAPEAGKENIPKPHEDQKAFFDRGKNYSIIAEKWAEEEYDLKIDQRSLIDDPVNNIEVKSCQILLRDIYNTSTMKKGIFIFKQHQHNQLRHRNGDYVFVLMYFNKVVTGIRVTAKKVNKKLSWDYTGQAFIPWNEVIDPEQILPFFMEIPTSQPIMGGEFSKKMLRTY